MTLSGLRAFLARLYTTEGFRGPVLTLFTGSSAALLLAYLCEPILTRLYTADQYGVMGYFSAVVATLFAVSSLRYDDALMLQEKDEDAATVVWLAGGVLAVLLAVLALALFWRHDLARLANMPELAPFLMLVPATLLAMRMARTGELWLMRSKAYRHVTAGQIANTTTVVTSRIGVGLPPLSAGAAGLSAGAAGLVGGFLAGNVACAAVNVTSSLRRSGQVLLRRPGIGAVLGMARRYKRFFLFSTPSSLVATLVYRLPVFLLPVYFADDELGYYVKAFAALAIPLSYAGNAVSRVFFVHAAEARLAQLRGRLTDISTMVHRRLVMIGLFPTLVLMVAGPDIFAVVFGEDVGQNWRTAGIYVQYIAPWLFFGSIVSPLTRIFDVLERQRLDLATSLVACACMTAALVIGGRTQDVRLLLLAVGITGSAARLMQLAILVRLARSDLRQILGAYAHYGLYSAPGLMIIAGALALGVPWLTTVAAVVAGLVFAGLVLRKEKLLSV